MRIDISNSVRYLLLKQTLSYLVLYVIRSLFFFQLICDAVLAAAGQIHQLLYQDEEFELDIPLIHYSYSLIQPRLLNFSELVHAFPDLVEKLLALRDSLDVEEMVGRVYFLIYECVNFNF